MATKSPGTYFSEHDNTGYQNLRTTEGTIVAVIGYATKGKVGVPTEITSYSNFVSTFGKPISDQYSGLAVKNILASGGKVLFTRVADTTLASKSSVIVKSGSSSTNGTLNINSTDAITVGTDGYENGNVYIATIKDTNGNAKTLTVRAPSNGKLSQANLYTQLSNSLNANFGYDELKMNSMLDGIYNFSLTNILGTDTIYGPYIIKTTHNQDGSDLATLIDKAINIDNNEGTKGVTNPYVKYYVVGTSGNGTISEDDGTFEPNIAGKKDLGISFKEDDIAISADRLTDGYCTFKYYFSLNGTTGASSEVKIVPEEGKVSEGVSFKYFVKQLNDKLETDTNGILHAKFVEGKTTTVDGATTAVSYSYILVFSTETNEFVFMSDTTESVKNPLFYKASDVQIEKDADVCIYAKDAKDSDKNKEYDGSNEDFRGLIIKEAKYTPSSEMKYHLTATYNSDTNSVIISPTSMKKIVNNVDTEQVTDYANTSVKIVSSGDLLNDVTKAFDCDFSSYLLDEEYNICERIANVKGEEKSKLSILKDITTKQIYFYQDSSIIAPSIEEREAADNETININTYKSLFDIIGEVVSGEVGTSDVAITVKEGKAEIKDASKDMTIFSANEYGSGTAGIAVEVYTTVSPIDDEDITHYVNVYVDNILKETFENVSYDMKSERYFAKLINEDVENNGSKYINVKVVKNEAGTIVNLPDSDKVSKSGYYVLGQPLNDIHNKIKTEDISEKAYGYYDYAIGNDGVATGNDGDELFIKIMDLEGTLANQDLFTFHILITPDNINQDVQDAAIKMCEGLGDSFYIADPPQGLTKKGVIAWHNGKSIRTTPLNSNFAATYWPWLKVFDDVSNKYSWVMPSVVMAAQYIKVDKNYGSWYAPAGETNGNISAIDLELYPNKTDRDELYVDYNRINPFVMYNDGTILAYDEKTLYRKNSTLTKIHTRRMLIQMKKEIKEALKGFIFMPTVVSNINTMVTYVTTIMEKYKVGGGVASYSIDTSKNTTETLQQDIIYIDINAVPVGCMEQVEISFNLNKSEETVTAN